MKTKLLIVLLVLITISVCVDHLSDTDDVTVTICCIGIAGALYCLYMAFEKNIKQLIDYIKS